MVELLRQSGYWENRDCWRRLGDQANNLGTVNNQQSDPVAALVEKVTNSLDARLMDGCFSTGMDPKSLPWAVGTPRHAVARFFEGRRDQELGARTGDIWEWSQADRSKHADRITISVSRGSGRQNTVSVADAGEGQAPSDFPDTLCSLHRSNKDSISFVQGRFNMGSTGALRFCGPERLQLIVSRRNPKYAKDPGPGAWGFTIVRRRSAGAGEKNSFYEYLAPVGVADRPGRGEVLSFERDTLPIFPTEIHCSVRPSGRESGHGTLVKMYDMLESKYVTEHALDNTTARSLLRRLEVCLADFALPVRVYDCRGTKKNDRAQAYGVVRRLDNPAHKDVLSAYPGKTLSFRVGSEKITMRVFLFRDDATARQYRLHKNAVIFCLNGQKQGDRDVSWIKRKIPKLSAICGSLFVYVDCSRLSPNARDDLFMANRESLAACALREEIEAELSGLIGDMEDLRNEAQRRLADGRRRKSDETATAVLKDLVSKDPDLARLLAGKGPVPLPRPDTEFSPRDPATYFSPVKKVRRAHTKDHTISIKLRTDAPDDYFERPDNQASDTLWRDGTLMEVEDRRSIYLHNGTATLRFNLPDGACVGDRYKYELVVNCPTQPVDLTAEFEVEVVAPGPNNGGQKAPKPAGSGGLPEVDYVGKDYPGHDEHTAIVIVRRPGAKDSEVDAGAYDWSWNEDNETLRRICQKETSSGAPKERTDAIQQAAQTFCLLVAMAAFRDHTERSKGAEDDDIQEVEDYVGTVSAAVMPFAHKLGEMLSRPESD